MLMLVLVVQVNVRQFVGSRWCTSSNRQACYSRIDCLVNSDWGMRLYRCSSTAAIASLLPSIPVVRAFAPDNTRSFRYPSLNAPNITPSRHLLKRQTRAFSARDLTEKDKDELEDDLYLLAASDTAKTATVKFASEYHAPVMWKECVDAMNSCVRATERRHQQEENVKTNSIQDNNVETAMSTASLIYIDGTLGGGGHSQALLESLLPGDIVFGADVDPDALNTATERLSQYSPRINDSQDKPWFIPVPSNFADITPQLLLDNLLSACNWINASPLQLAISQQMKSSGVSVDGILLDLGVSSYQIDTAERGFAFMKDGPLDMRMDRQGGNNKMGGSRLTAADLCNELDVSELRRIFKVYGDEPRARVIAESIVQRRPFATTNDLYESVAEVTPQFARKGRRLGRMATMARVFQSLRIVVNQEDVVLERALTTMAPALLRKGGRLVVLSYHSMEDRATKRVMRDGTVSKREAERNNEQRDMYGNYIGDPKPFRAVGKANKATPEEIELNTRARSATLRIAEKL